MSSHVTLYLNAHVIAITTLSPAQINVRANSSLLVPATSSSSSCDSSDWGLPKSENIIPLVCSSMRIGIFVVFTDVTQVHDLFSRSVVSNSLWPHGLRNTRLHCPSPSPGDCSNSCPSSQWCHPTISSSVIPFSWLQSFPASGERLTFLMI